MAWLQFFFAGVTEIALQAVGQAGRLMDLREKFRMRLRDKPKALILLDELFLNPYMSVSRAEKVLRVSNPTARQTVTLLQRKGMLAEITGRTWGKLYLAKPIMDTIELKAKAGSADSSPIIRNNPGTLQHEP